jgi:alanyl-tRNA synthetase
MDIRNKFLKYFKMKDHLILPSSGLIPENDSSVLLTTAGMQQFKPFFLGVKKPPAIRIATVQKCFRTSDIDSVGYTNRHCTFFEMLGNFSFGDYFKKEAIEYALDFILRIMKIPIDKIFITVFKGDGGIPVDTEAIKYWKESGIPEDRIYKFGKKKISGGLREKRDPVVHAVKYIMILGRNTAVVVRHAARTAIVEGL